MFPEVNAEGKCVACGHELRVGDYPQCPHHNVKEGGHAAFFQDDIPGGVVIENGVPEPTRVYSYSEMDRLRAQFGFRRKEKWCPMPGTDIDPAGVQNPARYQDAKTLENGAALVLRQAGASQAQIDEDLSKLFIPRDDMTLGRMVPMLEEAGLITSCEHCQGSGVIQVLDDDPSELDEKPLMVEQVCPTCQGSGKVDTEVKRGKPESESGR